MLGGFIGATARRLKRRISPVTPDPAALANQHRDARRWRDAAKAYWLILNEHPHRSDWWVQYGHVLKEDRVFDEAENAYRRAAALMADDWDSRLHLGHLLKLMGRFDEARDAYTTAADLKPDDLSIARELSASRGQYAIAAGDHARDRQIWSVARHFYEMAASTGERLGYVWTQLGRACNETGDYVAAEQAFRNALGGGPGDTTAWAEIARTLKLKGAYDEAALAFARAVIGGNSDPSTLRDLEHLMGFCAAETEVALQSAFVETATASEFVASSARARVGRQFERLAYSRVDPTGIERRHAWLARKAANHAGGQDIIWLPNIDWGYRTQRAQHLAAALAVQGRRVFFISPTAERARTGSSLYRLISNPVEGVFEVRLRVPSGGCRPLDRPVDDATADMLVNAVEQLCAELAVRSPVVFAQQPSWELVARRLQRCKLVYDCLDDQSAFPGAPASVGAAHNRMIEASDLVITTSSTMQTEIAAHRPSVLVRNAASQPMFVSEVRIPDGQPTIGYFGALGEWFEIDWVVHCAKARPKWRFVLAGEVGACDVAEAAKLPNIVFAGELPYDELPPLLRTFSVGIIPFSISRLTEVTDPVKLYEYMAGGCPVVASAMPEVIALNPPGVHIASSASDFEAAIAQCLRTDSDPARRERVAWASQHTWAARASAVAAAFESDVRPTRQATAS